MSNILACARARDAADWLAGYDPDDGHGPVGPDAFDFTRPVVIAAFVAGADRADQDFAIERAVGQRQLDDADALMREAADLFVGYAEHHRARASRAAIPEEEHASLQKASTNLLMAVRLKEWLAGEDRYTVNPAEVLREFAVDFAAQHGLTVDHAAFDEAAERLGRVEHVDFIRDQPGLECGQRRYTSRGDAHPFGDGVCRAEPFPIPAEIAEDGQLVHIDGKTREDCRQRFDNILNFTGAVPEAGRPIPVVWSDGVRFCAGCGLAAHYDWARCPECGSTDAKVSRQPGNVRPVTDGPLADPGVVEGLMGTAGMTDAARSLSMAKATAFRLQTPDPRFDPAKPVVVNGFLFTPATED